MGFKAYPAFIEKGLTQGACLMIQLYRWVVSPCLPSCCRFYPTCSAYGLEALKTHGFVYGLYLTLRRLLRCHPWGGEGVDGVPQETRTGVKNGSTR